MLDRAFYLRDANHVAKALLGKLLVHQAPGGTLSGMIVEVEAYKGPEDAAAHSYKGRRSARTEVMFGPGGYAYVYLIYGMHHCFNVVANHAGKPEAVLVRALAPVDGIDTMLENRRLEKPEDLCRGPGRLCKALSINKSHYGADLCGKRLYITDDQDVPAAQIVARPRVNVDYAGEAKAYLWRYYIQGSRHISKP